MSQVYDLNYTNDSIQRYSDVDIFSTQGRMGRKHYFVFSIVLPLIAFWGIYSLAGFAKYLPIASNMIFNGLIAIAIFATIVSMVYLTIQRCHDFNKSSALALLAVIPFANIIFAMIPGTNGLNSYGEVPLPGNWFLKTAFYTLIALIIALAVYISINLLKL